MSIEVFSVPLLELLRLPGSGEHEDLIDFIRRECWITDLVDPLIDVFCVDVPDGSLVGSTVSGPLLSLSLAPRRVKLSGVVSPVGVTATNRTR